MLHHHVMCGRGYQKVYTSSPNVLDEKVYIYIYLFISLTKMFLYYLFILTLLTIMTRQAHQNTMYWKTKQKRKAQRHLGTNFTKEPTH